MQHEQAEPKGVAADGEPRPLTDASASDAARLTGRVHT